MKKTLITLFFLLSGPVLGKVNQTQNINEHDHTGFSKEVTVHGMVCAFCSNSLKKKLKKEKAVKKINVNLGKKKVSVEFKKGKSISDKELRRIIASSGFTVVKIRNSNKQKTPKEEMKKDGTK